MSTPPAPKMDCPMPPPKAAPTSALPFWSRESMMSRMATIRKSVRTA